MVKKDRIIASFGSFIIYRSENGYITFAEELPSRNVSVPRFKSLEEFFYVVAQLTKQLGGGKRD